MGSFVMIESNARIQILHDLEAVSYKAAYHARNSPACILDSWLKLEQAKRKKTGN